MAGDTLKANELIQGAGDLAKEMALLNKEFKETIQLIIQGQKVFDKQAKSQGDVAKKTTQVKKATSELEKIQARANKVTLETVRATESLRKKRKALTDQVRKEQGTFKKSGGLFRSMTKSILAAGAAYFSLQAAITIVKKIVKTNAEFASGMSAVKAITGATVTEFKALQSNALLLGATTAKSAIEISKLQKEFAKLGFSTKEILNATEATINLSIAAGSDLANSAVVAASTIRGFALDAKESTKVVDIMAKSFTSSALDLEKFKTSMSIAAPIAKNFGKDLEFTTAQLAVLADTGLDASTSGTSLRNMFLELSKRGLTWDEGLEKINNSTNKNVTALELFGKRGATAAVILAENTQKAGQLEKQFRNSSGAAKAMADIMQNNLAGDAIKASSAVEGLFINIGKKLDPALRNVTQGFTRFVSNINKSLAPLDEQVNLYRIQDKELTTLFNSLKNTNISQDARNILIEEANTNYGEYLPNLLTEQSTLEDIAEAEKAINKQLRLKVIQQAFQEEITELLKAELKAKENLVKNEIQADQLAQERLVVTDEQGAAAVKNQELFLDISNNLANSTVENNAKEVSDTEEKFKRIGELYGIAFAEIEAALNESTEVVETTNDTIVENDKKKWKKLLKNQKETNKELHDANNLTIEEFTNTTNAFVSEIENEIESQLANEEAAVESTMQANIDARAKASERAIEIEAQKEEAILALKLKGIDTAGEIVSDRLTAGIDEDLAKSQAASDAEQEILKSQLDSDLTNLQMQLDSKQITEEQYLSQKKVSEEKFTKESEALERKSRLESAKAEKKKAAYNNVIDTITAVAKTFAELGWPAGIIPAGVMAGIGIANGIKIASEPLPKYEDGEVSIKAKRHSQGGKDINIEGGESVINREGTSNAKNLLTAINKGLIKDDILLPNAGKMFSGADSSELVKEHHSTIIGMEKLIEKQDKIIKAIESKQSQPILTEAGVRVHNRKSKSTQLWIDNYIRG